MKGPFTIFLATGALCAALLPAANAQPTHEWYLHEPWENGGDPYTWGGVAFSLGDLIYFGTGTNTSTLVTDILWSYDLTSNEVNFFDQVPGGPRRHGIAFAIGPHAYVGLGDQGGGGPFFSDIRRLNGNTGSFDQSYTFPGGTRSDAVVFTIDGKAYIGGGTTSGAGTDQNDLWEWDPATNIWTARANMPTQISGGAAFAVGGKGYVLRNGSTQFWCFDPVSNTWSVKAPFPSSRFHASAFALDGLGFIGLGDNGGNTRKDFHAYDPVADSWSVAPYLWDTYGRTHALATEHQGKAYVTGGFNYTPMGFDIWELGPAAPSATGVWVQRPFLPAPAREDPISFVIGGTAYLGGGVGTSTFTDLWAYDPDQRVWTARAALPGSMVEAAAVDGMGYGLRNTATNNFWAYDPIANAWSPRSDLPVPRTSTVAFGLEGKIHVTTGMANGSRLNDLWAYDPLTDTWEEKAQRPGNAVHAAAGIALGNKAYVYGGNTSGTNTTTTAVHRYDPASDTWEAVQSLPFQGNVQDHMAIAIGNMGYCAGGGSVLGIIFQYRNTFRGYDPMTNAWSTLPDLGGGARQKAAAFSVDGRAFIACGRAGSHIPNNATPSNDLWEYQPAWVTVSPRVFLGGPYDQGSGLMDHALNATDLVPASDPYATLLHPRPGGDFSDMFGGLQAMTGNDAIVDRVVVELRDAVDPAIIRAARHVWVQRDGDVVDMDGVSPVRFTLPPGNYYIAIRHRNHLGCMSAASVALSDTPTTVDFTTASTPTWGIGARRNDNGTMVLWPGDANFDGQVKYTGTDNDRDAVLLRVGGATPTNVVTGYYGEDVNMDGDVKYTGIANDRDIILQTIGGVVPTAVKVEQLP